MGERPCYGLKMDIRRFFDTVDHEILKTLIRKNIQDQRVLKIVDVIIDSFEITQGIAVVRKLSQGIDFVGYVLFPHHRLVRTRTKQRMKKKLREA